MRKFLLLLFLMPFTAFSQSTNTAEEKMFTDTSDFLSRTTLGGYGNALYQRDFNQEISTINLERFVLFVGHKFNDKISFFGELEFEDAKIEGGEEGGEVALEQALLRFNLNRDHYLVAGLFIPRFGILNENHLPTSFNGNERTIVETYVIPTTWRELGVALFGKFSSTSIHYSLGVMNGLNSAGFEHGSLIRSGRYEGSNASANNLAVIGSLQWKQSNLTAQVSGYTGGSVGLNSRESDSLQLESGMFGTPVMMGEANVQFRHDAIGVKVLGAYVAIPDAADINSAYSNNTPEAGYGFYAEFGYDLFYGKHKGAKQFIAFARYEKLDLNSSIPVNGIEDPTLDQSHIVAGINFLPITNVTIKADVRLMKTGEQNPMLVPNPSPTAPPYETENTFLNLGVGFAF